MAISGILVPLDGAGITASVLPTVAALARPMRAAVHLMAVVELRKRETPSIYYRVDADARPGEEDAAPLVPPDVQATLEDTERRVERARSYLATLAGRLETLGIESSHEAFVGDPMTDIVRLARRQRFGLIALSPHSRYAIGRGLGSVTDRVLHSSPIPLLVAPPLAESPARAADFAIRTVIVGVDGSSVAEAAFGPARQIAEASGARLILLRAIGGRAREAAWNTGAERVGRDIEADYKAGVRRYMEDAAIRIGVPCSTMLGDDDEVTEILNAANNNPSAIIVMASQGESGMTKWRLGSTTDRVIRESKRPVVVVPPLLSH